MKLSITPREMHNAQLLGLLALLVPIIWWLLLGWSPGELIDQHDNLTTGYVYKQQFIAVGGDWQQFLYWPELLGGVKVHDITGSLPLVQMLIAMDSDHITMSNLSIFLLQVLFGYFCARTVVGLSRTLGNNQHLSLLVVVAAGVMFAFLPVLGWRLTHGHQAIIQGIFVFLCMIAMLLDESNGERSAVTIILALVALTHTFQYNGFQTMYYSVLLGAPIVIALLFARPGFSVVQRIRWLVRPLLVFLCALLFSLPKLYGFLDNAFGDDTGRVADAAVIYSYTVASVSDWISSIPWSLTFIPNDRANVLHHEINYPIGAFVFLLLLARRSRPLLVACTGALISLLMALIISMNLQPFSDLLIVAVPMLESFRVPARSILPVLVFLSLMGTTVLLGHFSQHTDNSHSSNNSDNFKQWKTSLLFVAVLIISAMLPTMLIDIVLLTIILALLASRSYCQQHPACYLFTFAVFVGGAVGAFSTRIDEPAENPIPDLVSVRNELYSQAPELRLPLSRAYADIQLPNIGPNSLFATGISSLTGYWYPPSRFGRLFMQINGGTYTPTLAVFHNHSKLRGFSALNRLYNVGHFIDVVDGKFTVTPLEQTLGDAWFADRIEWQDNIDVLATELIAATNSRLRESALLLTDDPATAILRDRTPICQSAVVKRVSEGDMAFPLTFGVAVKGDCLLTISMNFSDIFTAIDQRGDPLPILPTYGALLGVLLSDQTTKVVITPTVSRFPGIEVAPFIALLMALTLIGVLLLRSPSEATSRTP